MATNQTVRERPTTYPAAPVVNEVSATNIALTDRVRWASILAGLFTVLTMMVVFAVLGLALGLSTFDANNPGSFGIGAGVYGIISALISFAIGGFISAKTAAVTGTGNAILQASLVWMVSIALMVNFIGSGIGTLLNVAGGAANTAMLAASNVADDAVQGAGAIPTVQAQATVQPNTTQAAPPVQATVAAVGNQVQEQLNNVGTQDVEAAARNISSAAWWGLAGLLASFIAALVGGLVGQRNYDITAVRTAKTTR